MRKKTVLTLMFVALAACLLSAPYGCSSSKFATKKKTIGTLYEEGLQHFFKGEYKEAENKFASVIFEFPFSPKAIDAELKLSELYYYQRKYGEAVAYLEDFVKMHPGNDNAPYAYYMLGMCYFSQLSSADRDQTAAHNASSALGELIAKYPDTIWADVAKKRFYVCIENLAKHEIIIGDFYFKRKNFDGAKERYDWLAKKYPSSNYAPRALFHLAKCLEALKENGKAVNVLTHLVNQYPESDYSKVASKLLAKAQILDEEQREKGARTSKNLQEKEEIYQSTSS